MTNECQVCAELTERWKRSMWTEAHLGNATKKAKQINNDHSHRIVAILREHAASVHKKEEG